MDANRQKSGLWASVDYWVREAFENEKSRTYGIVSNLVMAVIFYSIATIVLESIEG
jgi:hypothetical protein